MNLVAQIEAELAPFFRFAGAKNPSVTISTWVNNATGIRRHVAYANCVSCNTKRFSIKDLNFLRAGTDTYFCALCFKKVAEVGKKYDKGDNSEKQQIFNRVWNAYLFGRSRL